MHSTFLLLSFIGFFLALIYAIKEYFPDFYDAIVALFEIGLKGNSQPPTFDDDDILADSLTRGEWDESSHYYSSLHDMDTSSITDD